MFTQGSVIFSNATKKILMIYLEAASTETAVCDQYSDIFTSKYGAPSKSGIEALSRYGALVTAKKWSKTQYDAALLLYPVSEKNPCDAAYVNYGNFSELDKVIQKSFEQKRSDGQTTSQRHSATLFHKAEAGGLGRFMGLTWSDSREEIRQKLSSSPFEVRSQRSLLPATMEFFTAALLAQGIGSPITGFLEYYEQATGLRYDHRMDAVYTCESFAFTHENGSEGVSGFAVVSNATDTLSWVKLSGNSRNTEPCNTLYNALSTAYPVPGRASDQPAEYPNTQATNWVTGNGEAAFFVNHIRQPGKCDALLTNLSVLKRLQARITETIDADKKNSAVSLQKLF